MALPAKILIAWLLLLVPLVIEFAASHSLLDERRSWLTSDRISWPHWYQERLVRERHDRSYADGKQVLAGTIASSSPRSREDAADKKGSSVPARSAHSRLTSHHEEEQHAFEQHAFEQRLSRSTPRAEKFNALAVAEYAGTRAIAFAGYHNNNRHQQRQQLAAQSYKRTATTTPTYTRHHSGRRVCTRQAPTTSTHHHRGKQIRFVYTELSSSFLCCPGWSQVTQLSFGCNKPTCSAPCLNGGVCSSPGKCTCPKGYIGNQCQTDVNECVTEKPCDQLCRNLPGSYECYCRHGFHLLEDRQSCRKNDSDGTALEAGDLEKDFREMTTTSTKRPSTTSSYDTENEVGDADLDQDYEIILKRLTKLEKQIARGRRRDNETTDMSAKISLAFESISEMKRAIENVQLMQQEIYDMRSKMKEFELEARKIQYLTNRVADLESRLRSRCRSALPITSGSLHF